MSKKVCAICDKPHLALGFCIQHYRAFKLYGNPLHKLNARGIPFNHRFKKEKNGCWEWQYGLTASGYGSYRAHGEAVAHRVQYTQTFGPIPHNMLVCHTCDTPRCVNPEHLFLGTHQDNMEDMRVKKRARTRQQLPTETLQQIEIMLRSVQSNGFYTFSGREIAKLVGVSETAVYKRNKLRPEAPGYQRVADLYSEGKTQVKIAQELNIAQTTVSQILQRKRHATYSK